MRKNRRNLGFTMAELLVVVAIIMILASVSFIAVQRYQRSMAQLERNAVAKELFVAAQNHLTMAEGQSYPGVTNFGTQDPDDPNVYYFVYPGSGAYTDDATSVLDLMLPFGAIDETVRGGGSYIIRYQRRPALVLDAFYCSTAGSPARFNHTIASGEYGTFLSYRNHLPSSGYVVGWYGGEGFSEDAAQLENPSIEVENAERLLVRVTDPNKGNDQAQLKLIITGVDSGAQVAIPLSYPISHPRVDDNYDSVNGVYTVVLDDITTVGLRFFELNDENDRTGLLLPGENITVQAVAYSNQTRANIAYSGKVTTNSLFADLEVDAAASATTAMIGNLRHLENLDDHISNVSTGATPVVPTAARQIADLGAIPTAGGDGGAGATAPDLSWTGFVAAIHDAKPDSSTVTVCDRDGAATKDGCFMPVSPTYPLSYDGGHHAITEVKVDCDGPAGLFGAPTAALNASNLCLYNFDITGTGDAGALAGALSDASSATNVVVRHGSGADDRLLHTVHSASGSAGGLVGSLAGTASVSRSAAAVVVSADAGDAGGLVGASTSTGAITACYSGGHTQNGIYADAVAHDVTASGAAGGLVGSAGATAIRDSYSTCSVTGATAGGFVGTADGALQNCYCAGRVDGSGDGSVEGAFAGSLSGTPTLCRYLEIVNPRQPGDANPDNDYLTPLGGSGVHAGITRIDESADTYNAFVGAPALWREAEPCDARADTGDYYKVTADKTLPDGTTQSAEVVKYGLGPLSQLGDTVQGEVRDADGALTVPADFVTVHYGDWPSPETYVRNAAG